MIPRPSPSGRRDSPGFVRGQPKGQAAEATFEWLKVERNPPRTNRFIIFSSSSAMLALGRKLDQRFPALPPPHPDPAGRDRHREREIGKKEVVTDLLKTGCFKGPL